MVRLARPARRRVAGCCPEPEIFIVMYVPPVTRITGTLTAPDESRSTHPSEIEQAR
jgi:hypothetical protein